jgi:DNA-binding PadR family transcriptional regulator
MREPTFLVLAALADGRKHGYALIKEADEMSAGRVQLKVGTLYASLERLSDDGLVRVAGDEVVDGRNRRYFELTGAGRERLAAEAQRQQANAKVAFARLKASPAP